MKLKIKKDKTKYLNLVDQYPLPLFLQEHWLDLITMQQWEAWIIVNEEEQVIGLMSLPYQTKLGKKVYRNPIFHPYSGPYFFENELNTLEFHQKIWKLLWSKSKPHQFWMELHGYPQFSMNSSPIILDEDSFLKRVTYFLDLSQSEEALFNHIRSRRRNYIRKISKDFNIKPVFQPHWAKWLEWLSHSFSRKNASMPYTEILLEEVFQLLAQTKNQLFLSVEDDQENEIAVLWIMYDEERAYQMWSAFDPIHSEHGVMEFLVWEAIKEMKYQGKLIYDFEGSMEAGIARFFHQMGGVQTYYLGIQPAPHWLIKGAKILLK